MRVTYISNSTSNQIRNNKIQKQKNTNPIANNAISFGAKITYEMNRDAWRSILPNFLETDEHAHKPHARSFWKLDDKTISAIARMSDDKTKNTFATDRIIVSHAHKEGKIEQLLQFAKNDDEILDILNTRLAHLDKYKSPRIEGPLKGALSFQDLITVLDKMQSKEKKKELLLSSWEQESSINYLDKNPIRTRETIATRLRLQDFSLEDQRNKPSYGPCGHTPKEQPSQEQMLKNMQKLYFNIVDIVQDDSTTNKEAVELIKAYKEFCGPAYKFYFDEIEKQFTKQIVLSEE